MNLAAVEIPRIPVGEALEAVIDWLIATFGVLLDAIASVLEWTYDGLTTFLLTPTIIGLALLFGVIAFGLRGWKIGVGAFAGAAVLGYLAAVTSIPPVFVLSVTFALLGFALRGWKFGLFSLIGFVLIGGMDLWDSSMETLSLVLIASALAVLLAVPVGILAARNDTVSQLIRPVLDVMQTLPPFVYLIPAILIFGVGPVPGAVATVIFAMAPGVRLVELGIRQVDREVVEAGEAFGASPMKILARIQLPLALPTIMAGVNQVIMLALSMVVIAGLVGAGGLGGDVYSAISNAQIGEGFEAGIAVVILAIYLDRLTAALTSRSAVVRAAAAAGEQ
ncbi:ABC transporter permease subunit [Actinopolymorpha sp. B17G11]|uniref:ABC transporter permease n=1 Tax=unclassified Actinopolymorpha TaxID=2627063 RepID=UPI0032D936B6